MNYWDPELDLLSEDPVLGEDGEDTSAGASGHALRTAPIFTGDVFNAMDEEVFPQRALYGTVVSQHTKPGQHTDDLYSPKLYINTNTPFSALICGVQGSGKSHSTSVLLEGCLIDDERIGTLPAPLSALVFHFDTAAGGGAVQPCEAAYLSTMDTTRITDVSPPPVVVLVVPTYLRAMRRVYAGLPVRVEPLSFSPEDISGERLLAMMKVDDNGQMPLYMESIMAILRSMEDDFCYSSFREQLSRAKFNSTQKAMLDLRLSLLDSCLDGGDTTNSIKNDFQAGQLTIVDLSSPFMDGASACGFFDIILGLFVEAEICGAGKVVVLDEAHKYLSESQSGTSGRLTESLLTVIRQQRHLATRVVVSTQEPTVVPSKFLDLCSIIIAHHFSSPKWLKTLAQHVSAADFSTNELFDKIVSLETGQAVLFAPNGLCLRSYIPAASWEQPRSTVDTLGQGFLVVRSRLRLTRDGGHSLLAVSAPGMTTRIGRVSGRLKPGASASFQHPRPTSYGAERPMAVPVSRPAATSWSGTSSGQPLLSLSSYETTLPRTSAPPTQPHVPAMQHPNLSGVHVHLRRLSSPSLSPPVERYTPYPAPGVSNSATSKVYLHTLSSPPPPHHTPHPNPAMSTNANNPRVIDMTNGTNVYFAPLVQYIRSTVTAPSQCLRLATVARHFFTKAPHMYGNRNQIKKVVGEAAALNLVSIVNKKYVQCVGSATYHF